MIASRNYVSRRASCVRCLRFPAGSRFNLLVWIDHQGFELSLFVDEPVSSNQKLLTWIDCQQLKEDITFLGPISNRNSSSRSAPASPCCSVAKQKVRAKQKRNPHLITPQALPPCEPLAEEEYQFDRVPLDELWACLYYEVARESNAFSLEVKLWRIHEQILQSFDFESLIGGPLFAYRLASKVGPGEANLLTRFGSSPYRIALAHQNFVTTPWLSIPFAERRAALKRLRWESTHKRLSQPKRDLGPLWGNAKLWEESFFVRDWGKTDHQIQIDFAEWLRATRQTLGIVPDMVARKTPTASSLLKHLGIFRACRRAVQAGRNMLRLEGIVTLDKRDLDESTIRKRCASIQRHFPLLPSLKPLPADHPKPLKEIDL